MLYSCTHMATVSIKGLGGGHQAVIHRSGPGPMLICTWNTGRHLYTCEVHLTPWLCQVRTPSSGVYQRRRRQQSSSSSSDAQGPPVTLTSGSNQPSLIHGRLVLSTRGPWLICRPVVALATGVHASYHLSPALLTVRLHGTDTAYIRLVIYVLAL